MTLHELDTYFRSFLHIEDYMQDSSKNGIQVENSDIYNKQIKKVAFTVDACIETIEKAIENDVDVIFVHHGIFWGHEQTITGNHFKRIKMLIDNDIALYACHIPLDAHTEVGNNYGLANMLNLKNIAPFGEWKKMTIGVKGFFETEKTLDDVINLLRTFSIDPTDVLAFGKKSINSIAIVSGGAEDLITEAIADSIDVYVTGEISHQTYHVAKEHNIHLIAGGHYATETIGVSLVAKKLTKEKQLETIFFDVPTGL